MQCDKMADVRMIVLAEKSASVSHSRTSSLALDIMSPWTTRSNRDLNGGKDKGKEKEKCHKAAPAVGKENAAAPKHPKDAQARSGHARSQSQPKLQLAAAAVEGTTRPSMRHYHNIGERLLISRSLQEHARRGGPQCFPRSPRSSILRPRRPRRRPPLPSRKIIRPPPLWTLESAPCASRSGRARLQARPQPRCGATRARKTRARTAQGWGPLRRRST